MTLPSFDPGFSTDAMSAVFSPDSFVRAMLRVECALAVACAAHGLVSESAVHEIFARCAEMPIDGERVLRNGWEAGTPVVALLAEVRSALSPEASAALHFGATTQDIVDNAIQLQIREARMLITEDLRAIVGRLGDLAKEFRTTPMMARTFLQHAGPTTFGLGAAQWLVSMRGQSESIDPEWARGVVQLGGAVGVLDAFGDVGQLVMRDLALELRLHDPGVPWHGNRSPVVRVLGVVHDATRSAAKIATDVALLSSTEIGEVRVRGGGSSSIPGKHNPIDAVRVIAAAAACAGAVHTLSVAPAIELERGVGGWHAEWFAVPVAFMTAAAAIEALRRCLDSLTIDESAMRRNLGDVDATAAIRSAGRLVDRILADKPRVRV